MPKFEARMIQKELESNKVRSLYWIHGPERMKVRELIRRIEKSVLADQVKSEFNFEKYDGSEHSLDTILDSFQSFSMLGGTKLIVVHNADELKNLDSWIGALKNLTDLDSESLQSVAVFTSKTFDSRRKWAKAFQDEAAVVSCEEVAEHERDVAIEYLAKRHSLTLTGSEKALLRCLDPWSLDIVNQELSKMSLLATDAELREEIILSGVDARARDEFIDAVFCRDQARALNWVNHFSAHTDAQLPLLGLIAWNCRQLKGMMLGQEIRNPYVTKNLDRWRRHWNMPAVHDFEDSLFTIDFSIKNTRLAAAGLWANMIYELKAR